MPSLEEVKKKINNTQALHTIVKTMKSLASVSIRQYERAVYSLQDYHRTLELSFRMVLKHHGVEAIVKSEPPRHLIAVVFGSDQGLCGTLNEVIANHVTRVVLTQEASSAQRLAAQQQPAQDLSQTPTGIKAIEEMISYGPFETRTLFGVGERAAIQLEDRGWNLQQIFPVPISIAGVTPVMRELLLVLDEKRQALEPVQILLFHNRPVETASFVPVCTPLWPVDQRWLTTLQQKPWPTRQFPGFDLPWRTLFSTLLQQHLFVSLYRSCVESLASEFASRLASMQSAEKNIESLLDELGLAFQQQRQDAITSELLDIVAGAEALR